MDMELPAMPGRKKSGPAYAGAASLLLHVLLAAGFLYCLPAAVTSGSGGVFTLSLLEFPGTEQGGGIQEQRGAPAESLPAPAPSAEIQKQESKKKNQALSSKPSPQKKNRDSSPQKKAKAKDSPSSIKTSGSISSSAEPAGTSSSGAGGSAFAASAGNGADVPFGRPCGPGFTRFSRPVYPLQARRAGISGLVKLRVSLDAAGSVRGIEVLESGHHLLADAACAAIRRSEFRPYTQDGKSLPSRTVIPIRFSLEQ